MPSNKRKLAAMAAAISGIMLLSGGLASCSRQSPDALVAEAAKYRQKGDEKAAIIQLKNALQQNPNDGNARYLLGVIYNETGDPLSAEKEIRRAGELGVPAAKTAPQLARSLLAQNEPQKALDALAAAGDLNDANAEIVRGNIYLALGKSDQAKSSFNAALKLQPDTPLALVGLAKIAFGAKDLDGAGKLVDQAVAKNPNSLEALHAKADLLRAQGKNEEALATYDAAIKVKPDNIQSLTGKANLDIAMRRYDDARIQVDAAKKVAPNAPLVNYTAALLDFSQGKFAPALDEIQQVTKIAPDHMPSLLLTGAIQYGLGNNEQAELLVKRYLEANPGNDYATKLLAAVMLKNGDPKRALSVLNPALENAKQDPQLLSLAGESYMRSREFDKAEQVLAKASELSPGSPMIRTALGMSKLAQGENSSGMAELEAASKMDANNTQPGVVLVMTQMRMRQYDKALESVNKLEKEKPNDASIKTLKGNVLLAKGDLAGARQSFDAATKIDPRFFPPVANLAQIDAQEKKPDAAKSRLETFLEQDKQNIQVMGVLANLAMSQGHKEEATSWLEKAANLRPNDIPPQLQLGMQYLRTGDKDKAAKLAQAQVIAHPTSPEVLDFMAQAQLANNDKAGALETYRKLAAVQPNSALAQYRIATVQMAMRDEAGSVDSLKRALTLKPDYLDAQLAMAAIDVRKGNGAGALDIARQIQKQQPQSPVGYALEGDVQMMQKKPAQAVQPYGRALDLSKNALMVVKQAEALDASGRGKDADASIAAWLKDHPQDNGVRLQYATAKMAKRDYKGAIDGFQEVLKQEPNNVAALNNLALAYQQQHDSRALEYAEKALKLAPDNPAVLDTAGSILVASGDTARGLGYLQKAAAAAPNSPNIRYNLAVALAKNGDKANAKKELEQLVANGGNFEKMEEAKALLKTM
ncbi:XrtA/PEP-CTERM system TPR-repeat protein PrsT [Noviherbaspirillum pedocola]|uniref:PEP-CTERM system TPR-repeat protein PrsT n=1 Tax=Noviherbaspirillum pedocola TaxID=2801341 RepID=A0A934SPG6_9BURK|nr:XrtA/PEP-CTERM system TPR-repeat protein PrsT [Noviherbaspirillum pedocola]MBK4734311.1 PEP-CTERM system TPR-repeat protein PrsT [Noviherbaspirillum pedocola]